MEAKHTKGQWFACKITNTTNYSVRTNERPELVITPVNLTEVNETIHNDLIGEAIANAKLIAAAPELLNLISEMDECNDRFGENHRCFNEYWTKRLKDAIKKATE